MSLVVLLDEDGFHAPRAVAPREAPIVTTANPATVIVVEDDDTVLHFLTRCLLLKGFRVLLAKSGGECMDMCRSAKPGADLVILDVLLPDTTGPSLSLSLARLFPGTPTLFVSGLPPGAWPEETQQELTAILRENPRCRFLAKPFSAPTLMEAIGALRRESRAAAKA